MSWSYLQAEVPLCFFQKDPSNQPLGLTPAVKVVPQDSMGDDVPWCLLH